MNCIFVSDLHGNINKYGKLFNIIVDQKPDAVFIGGDILPSGLFHYASAEDKHKDFINDFLAHELSKIKRKLGKNYPKIFVILGNDDAKIDERELLKLDKKGLIHYIHFQKQELSDYSIFGYSYTPPSPFLLKDWEKYDVSRYVDPGCISPEEGRRTVEVNPDNIKFGSIQKDLEELAENYDLTNSIFLFHGPPHQTNLDRAALDGKKIDHAPLDVHVGSIAIKRFIEKRQPYITLHGHIHESSQITGKWNDQIGRTFLFNAAYHGKELSVIKFNSKEPEKAERLLL